MDPAPANLSRTNPSPRRAGAMRSVLRRKPDIPHWSWAGPSGEKLWEKLRNSRSQFPPSRWRGAPSPRWRHRAAAVAHGSPPEKLPGLKVENIREVYFKIFKTKRHQRHQNTKTGRLKKCKVTKSEEN